MLDKLFDEYLYLSKQLRPKYPQSLGCCYSNWENVFAIINSQVPSLFRTIYEKVAGTKREIKEQELMDFIPGYRLIHISEIIVEVKNMKNVMSEGEISEGDIIIPILANYSSDFVCYYKPYTGEELIVSRMNDSCKHVVMHNSPEKFLETICEFYKQNVYFLDADGYLDYDYEKQSAVGSAMNPKIMFWSE